MTRKDDNETLERLRATAPNLRSAYRMVLEAVWSQSQHPARGAELMLVLSGELTLTLADGRKWRRRAGELLVVEPGAMHRDCFDPAEPPSLWYCAFDWEATEAFLAVVDNDALGRLSRRAAAEAGRIFELMESDLAGGGEADRAVSCSRLHTLLLTLYRDLNAPKAPTAAADSAAEARRREVARQAREFIAANYARALSLDDIADALDISAYYLAHLFQAGSGQTIFNAITAVRMGHAERMLRQGRETIAEIARAVGYQDPNYFSRAFKRWTGRTPSAFRRGEGEHGV